MKNFICKSDSKKTRFSWTFLCIVALIVSFQFASCKNFLNAENISDEIKDAIAYNNAKNVNVSIECKEDMGTVFPQLSYQAKVGYPFEIQFIPNTEKYIIKDPSKILQAVSRIDKDQSRADYVEFKVAEQTFEDKKAGLYRIEVKVVKYADDIQIAPDCIPCPAIKSTSPERSTTGHYANTPVIFTFNVPIENDNPAQTVFYYGENSITVISNEGEMSKFFDKPVLNSDKTKLTLTPRAKELSDFIKKKNLDYLDIKVSFSSNISIVQGGVPLSFVQNDYSTFTVRYMDKIERNAPTLVDGTFFATRHSLSLSDAQTFPADKKCLIITLGNFQEDAEYLQNRIRNELYICGKYLDAESGVKCIKVSAQLTNDYKGNEKDTIPESYDFFVSEGNNSEFLKDDEGNVSFCAKIDNLDVFENGAVKVTVKALDYCNNVSEVQTFTVFKKSFGDEVFDNIEVGNAYEFKDLFKYNTLSFDVEVNENEYNNYLKTLYLEDKTTQILYYKSGYKCIPKENYTYKCVYREKNGNTGEFIFDNKEVAPYTAVLKATKKLDLSISGLSFTIYVSDDIGNSGRKDFKIPDNDKLTTVCSRGSYSATVEVLYSYSEEEEVIPLSFPFIWIKEDETDHKLKARNSDTEISLHEGNYKYIAHWGDNASSSNQNNIKSHFFSEISENKTTVTLVEGNSKNINANYSIQTDSEDGWLDVTVTINSNQDFDSYYLSYPEVTKESTTINSWRNYFYESDNLTFTFKTSTRLYFSRNLQIWLYGIKDGIRDSKRLFPISGSYTPEAKYDNYAPRYEIKRDNYGYFKFVATDVGSGIKNGTVTVNRTGHKFDFSDDGSGYYYCAYVPIQEFLLGNNSVTVNIKDNQNNTLEKRDTVYLDYDSLAFEKAEKKDEGWRITTGIDNEYHHPYYMDIEWSLLNTSETNPEWSAIKEYFGGAITNNPDNSYSMNISFTFSNYGYNSASEYSFLKIMTKPSEKKYGGAPMYIYAGSANPNGYFDYILPNTNESVLVMSDGPTYIHAVSTPTDYEECKDWSIAQWETYNNTFGDVYWAGSSTAYRNYQIDMTKIRSGESYCVIAYFAKGKPAKSAVMVKP